MTVNWQEFTPITSLIGGAILGLGAVLLIIFKGRIAGISGIVGALMQFQNTPKDHYLWRILFLLGLIGSYPGHLQNLTEVQWTFMYGIEHIANLISNLLIEITNRLNDIERKMT